LIDSIPIIRLSPQKTKIAILRAKKFGKKGKWKGEWGSGLVNTDKLPVLTEILGSLGEQAIHEVTGWEIDEEERIRGDKGWDFEIPNNLGLGLRSVRINAKLRQKDYGKFYVKAKKTENSPLLKFKADVYLFCTLSNLEELKEKVQFDGKNLITNDYSATVTIDGCINTNVVKTMYIGPALSPKYKHYNYYFYFDSLYCLRNLMEQAPIWPELFYKEEE